MRSSARPLVVLIILSLWLAACTLQVNTVVQSDGSGELLTEFGFSAADRQMLENMGSTAEQFCQEMNAEGPEVGSVRVEERGGELWCIIAMPFASLSELEAFYGHMEGVSVNQLDATGDELVYDVDVQLSGEETEGMPFAPTARWQVTVPGRVVSSNADSTQGQTLTWELALGEARNIQVTSTLSGGGAGGFGLALPGNTLLTALLALCCCGGLLGAGGLGAFVLVRRWPATPPAA